MCSINRCQTPISQLDEAIAKTRPAAVAGSVCHLGQVLAGPRTRASCGDCPGPVGTGSWVQRAIASINLDRLSAVVSDQEVMAIGIAQAELSQLHEAVASSDARRHGLWAVVGRPMGCGPRVQRAVISEDLRRLAADVSYGKVVLVHSSHAKLPDLNVLEAEADTLRCADGPAPGAKVTAWPWMQRAIVAEDLRRFPILM
mmetsp:Transcript_59157/g.138408  ORF Transcript_59157/g.138408 Transcript_59157/m.138408 type:complete len:200 (-) Transcript_59157:2300-2899(-)